MSHVSFFHLFLSITLDVNRCRIFNPDIVVRMRTMHIYIYIFLFIHIIYVSIFAYLVEECHIVFNLYFVPLSILFISLFFLSLSVYRSHSFCACMQYIDTSEFLIYTCKCGCVAFPRYLFSSFSTSIHIFLFGYNIAKSPKYSVYTKTLCNSDIEHAKTDFFCVGCTFFPLNSAEEKKTVEKITKFFFRVNFQIESKTIWNNNSNSNEKI